MGELPSRDEALAMLRSVGCPPGVIKHCERVADLALSLARACLRAGLEVDLELVEVGALLHDMGRARTHSIGHVFLGAEMARELGLPDEVVRIILTHAGGVRPELAEAFGWPPGDYGPEGIEEKIVAYADKLVRGPSVVPFEEALRALEEELGPDHPAVGNLAKIHEELGAFLGEALGGARPAGEDIRSL